MNFQEIRQKYPEYSDMSDADFASKFHQKFYSDMSFDDFSSKVGYAKEQPKAAPTQKTGLFDNFSVDKALQAAVDIPKQMWNDVVGANEAALSLGTGATTGIAAGTIGGLQGIIDSGRDGTFGTKEGVRKSGEKFMEQMDMGTYAPRTKRGQEMLAPIGEAIATHGPSLMGIAPQLEALGALQKARSAMPRPEPIKVPSADAQALAELRAKKVAPETALESQPVLKTQTELDLGEMNQYGHRPSDFTVDENGIPIRRNASLEAQETVRQGDLFSLENQANELRNDVLNSAKPQFEEGFPANREYLKQQEIEQAYLEKQKQDSLFKEEPVTEPSQAATNLEKMSDDRITNRPSPNRGKFGQGGAIDPDVFLKDFPEFVNSAIKDAAGKLKVLYHGTSADKIFDNFKKSSRGIFLTDDPKIASDYARANDSKGLKPVPGTWKYEEVNTADRVVPVYANIQKPYRLTPEEITQFSRTENYAKMQRDFAAKVQAQGFDGIIYPDGAIVALDPKQIVSATSPKQKQILGQTKMGKGQRGSVGFFGKDPYEKFAENLRKEVPDVTDAELKQLWEQKQLQTQQAQTQQTQAIKQGQLFQKATGLDPKYTGEVWEPTKAVEVFSTTPDMDARSLMKEQIASSGRLQRDLFNHPVTTWVYNLTTRAVENGRLMARKVLDDNGTGVIPMIRKKVMLGGQKEMREYFKWRFANEGGGTELPSTFSPEVRKIHEALNKGDEQLLAKMNEVLAKDGKEPITQINNHMVHYWSGPYRAYVYVKTANGGSRLAFFVSEKSQGEALKALNWIKKNVPNVDTAKSTGVSFVKADVRNRSSMFDHLLDLSNEKDPTVREALQAFKERVQGAQERHLGEQHRQEYRVGVQGFQGNKPWLSEARNYADAVDSIRTKFDAGYQWVAAQEIRQAMEPVLKAQQEGQISVGNALSIAQRYVDHALGKNVDLSALTKLGDYLESMSPRVMGATRRGVGHTQDIFSKVTIPWLLMLKGTQAAQSVLQVGQATIPRMLEMRHVYGGEYHHIATSLAQGSMDGLFQLANTVTGGKYEALHKLITEKTALESTEVTKAIHEFIKENDVARMSLSDTNSSREGGFFKSYGNFGAEILLNAPMNLFEGPTRTWAFSSYVRQAIKEGHELQTALRIGKEAMDTMVNYNPEAGSMGLANLGIAGREARGLHTFMINYYTQLGRYSKLAIESGGKQAGPLAAYLAITFALGGAIGFIGTDLADWLIDGIKAGARGKDWDSPELQNFSLRKFLLENADDNISVGPLSAQTGLGLYGSFTTKVVDPDRTLLDNMFPKTMASLQLAKAVTKTPTLFDDEATDKERGAVIEGLAPKYLTQSIRNRYQNKDGVVYDPNPDHPGLPIYKRTEKEQKISEKGLGIRGLGEVMAGEDMRGFYKGQKAITESQKAQLTKLDKDLIAAWKLGAENVPDYLQNRIQKQSELLVSKWGVDEDQFTKHIEKLAQDYGLPEDALRKLVQIKNPKLRDVQKIQDLSSIINRRAERQERYGR